MEVENQLLRLENSRLKAEIAALRAENQELWEKAGNVKADAAADVARKEMAYHGLQKDYDRLKRTNAQLVSIFH